MQHTTYPGPANETKRHPAVTFLSFKVLSKNDSTSVLHMISWKQFVYRKPLGDTSHGREEKEN